jgi:threonine dehydrogenase-like Zn-dependent dehydrogenase
LAMSSPPRWSRSAPRSPASRPGLAWPCCPISSAGSATCACGQCYLCRRGRQGLCRNLRITGMSWPWGGLAQCAVVPAYQAIPLPDGVSYEQGAILVPLGTCVYAAERARLLSGDTVLITGAGPVGQLMTLVAQGGRCGQHLCLGAEYDPSRTDRADGHYGCLRPGEDRCAWRDP